MYLIFYLKNKYKGNKKNKYSLRIKRGMGYDLENWDILT